MTPIVWVGVAAAGAVGACLRYLIDGFVRERTRGDLPWGTFAVNITGSLILGFLAGLGLHSTSGEATTHIIGLGMCGALTTFSTFSFEVTRLLEVGDTRNAAVNLSGSLAVGIGAAGAGIALGLLVA